MSTLTMRWTRPLAKPSLVLRPQRSCQILGASYLRRLASTGTSVAGYSGTPLAKKLGIKEGNRIRVSGAPTDYQTLVGPIPQNVTVSNRITKGIDIWHFFTNSVSELEFELPKLMRAIQPNGAIWISWPKKSSGVPSSVTEDLIRAAALPLGLVDIKVCAVDNTWSGLKLVIRKEFRK